MVWERHLVVFLKITDIFGSEGGYLPGGGVGINLKFIVLK